MAGKVLRCDHDGCAAEYPPAPVRGYRWQIRAAAEKAGWVSSRSGLYSVDDDADRTIRDYCPEHTSDLDRPACPEHGPMDVIVHAGSGVPVQVVCGHCGKTPIDLIEVRTILGSHGGPLLFDEATQFEMQLPIRSELPGCVGRGGYPDLGTVAHPDRITVTVNTDPIGDLGLQRVLTRPQDWAPAARALLFPDR